MQVLTKEETMFSTRKRILAVLVVVGLVAIGANIRTAIVAGQTVNAAPRTANAAAPAITPDPQKVAAGED
jgi:hypothetical protein